MTTKAHRKIFMAAVWVTDFSSFGADHHMISWRITYTICVLKIVFFFFLSSYVSKQQFYFLFNRHKWAHSTTNASDARNLNPVGDQGEKRARQATIFIVKNVTRSGKSDTIPFEFNDFIVELDASLKLLLLFWGKNKIKTKIKKKNKLTNGDHYEARKGIRTKHTTNTKSRRSNADSTDSRYTRTRWGRRRSRFFPSFAAAATVAGARESRATVQWRPLPAGVRTV